METAAIVLILIPVVAYLGYPVVLLCVAALVPRRAPVPTGATPPISIVICAHNEAATIGAKLDSVIAALAQWPGVAEIVVGDDASGDDTCAIVARFAGVRLVRAPRGGKAATLNLIAPFCTGDILVMSDADPLFDASTIPALIAPFADPGVGAVAGSVETIRSGRSGARRSRFAAADGLFRVYESAMRAAEDRLFGCVSADGGIYAIRRPLMPHVAADATDDFYISTAAVAAGYRIAFAPEAKVHEHSIPGDRQQFRRRVRITVRGMTGLWRRRTLMNPGRTGWYAVALVMHKLARRLAPLALPPLWLLSALLAGTGWWWALLFAGLSGGFALGAIGFLTPLTLPRPLMVAYGAMLHLAGLGIGVVLFLSGRRYAQWTPQKAVS